MFFDDLNAACTSAFGEAVTLHRPGRSDATVTGIFDRRHYGAEVDGVAVSSLHTTVTVVDADTGPVPAGAQVTARGTRYGVADQRPDGQGMTVLVLRDA